MSKTIRSYTSDGAQVLYPIDFVNGFIKREYVYVYLDTEDYTTQLTYTWISDSQIQLTSPVANGLQFHIRRVIPRDDAVNDYQDGAILKEKNLDDSYDQALMILEEVEDGYVTGPSTKIEDLIQVGQGASFVQEARPSDPVIDGVRWYKPSEATTYVWYTDDDSGQWVEENPSVVDAPNRIIPFDTVAEATADTSLAEGNTIQIAERGNGIFNVISGTGTADNRGIVAHTTLNLSISLRDEDIYCDPKKYGANETDDATSLLNTLLIQENQKRLVLVNARYKITSTAGNSAIQIHDNEGLITPMFLYHTSGTTKPLLLHTGEGDGVEVIHTNGTSSPEGASIENVLIVDSDGLGGTGLITETGFVAGRYTGACKGWANGISCSDGFWYTRMDWDCHDFRTLGAAFGGQINAGTLKLRLSSDETAIDRGLSIGSSVIFGSDQRTSNGVDIDASSEVSSGTPVDINLVRGGNIKLYFETPGDYADYDATAVILGGLEGVNVSLAASTKQNRGFAISNSRDVNISGYIEDVVNEGGRIESTCVGINTAGLVTSEIVAAGVYTTGKITGASSATNESLREGWGTLGQRPSVGTWARGSTLHYTNITESGNRINSGAKVLTSGTEGTLAITGTGLISEKIFTASDASALSLGDILSIATVSGTYVVNGFSGTNDVIVDTAFASGFTAQNVTYVAPTYAEQYIDTV